MRDEVAIGNDAAWAKEFDGKPDALYGPVERPEDELIIWFDNCRLYCKYCPWCGKKVWPIDSDASKIIQATVSGSSKPNG